MEALLFHRLNQNITEGGKLELHPSYGRLKITRSCAQMEARNSHKREENLRSQT